ncbi:MAG: hypothetical protein ABI169_07320 [Chitinophagaceae bacterium]
MKQTNQNALKMWDDTLLYLNNKQTQWAENPVFSTLVDRLQGNIAAADVAMIGQTATSTGLSADKVSLEITAVNLVTAMASSAMAYALFHDDKPLEAQVDFGKNALMFLPEKEQVARFTSIVRAIEQKQGLMSDFGIKPNTVLNANAAIAAYGAALQNPRNVIAEKSVISKSIPTLMKEGRATLRIMDKMVHIFDEINPGFSAGYKAARVIVDAGIRHNPPAPAALS